jgi:hypothetical protein
VFTPADGKTYRAFSDWALPKAKRFPAGQPMLEKMGVGFAAAGRISRCAFWLAHRRAVRSVYNEEVQP